MNESEMAKMLVMSLASHLLCQSRLSILSPATIQMRQEE